MSESPYDMSLLSDQQKLNFDFVFNSVNFCYWGDPKWTVVYKDKQYDGSWGMLASLGRALEENIPILDATYFSTLGRDEFSHILKGEPKIPLFDKRLDILQENGKLLLEKYQGQFSHVLERAGYDTLRLLKLLTADFPSFDDHVMYNGQKVLFHKRAQLLVSDIYRIFKGKGYGELAGIDQLTAFADYKIPQYLRKVGILAYSSELEEKIDSKRELLAGSREEIEIRAATIWGVELMRQVLKSRIPGITSIAIDSYIWLASQQKSLDDKPYHLTKTIFY